jgi:hypothetical protein
VKFSDAEAKKFVLLSTKSTMIRFEEVTLRKEIPNLFDEVID